MMHVYKIPAGYTFALPPALAALLPLSGVVYTCVDNDHVCIADSEYQAFADWAGSNKCVPSVVDGPAPWTTLSTITTTTTTQPAKQRPKRRRLSDDDDNDDDGRDAVTDGSDDGSDDDDDKSDVSDLIDDILDDYDDRDMYAVVDNQHELENVSSEVREVLQSLLLRQSVLLTGGGGTGKTTSVIDIVNGLKQAGRNVLLTGSTGQAAATLQAALHAARGRLTALPEVPRVVTVDAYEAFNLELLVASKFTSNTSNTSGKQPADAQRTLLHQARTQPGSFAGLRSVADGGVIVVDEISMISAEKLRFMVDLANIVIQTPVFLLVGDFYQLQPVEGEAAFDSDVMQTLTDGYRRVVTLSTNRRQQDDPEYIKVLEQIRVGTFDSQVMATIDSMTVAHVPTLESALHIAPVNAVCDAINAEAHGALRAKGCAEQLFQHYPAQDLTGLVQPARGGRKPAIKPLPDSMCQTVGRMRDSIVSKLPNTQSLCVGERVILTTNIDVAEGLAHGVRGVVVKFRRFGSGKPGKRPPGVVVVRRDDNDAEIEIGYTARTQKCDVHGVTVQTGIYYLPLQPASAITVHAAQGRTLRCQVVVHLEDNQGRPILFGDWCRLLYVALSRGQRRDTYIKGRADFVRLQKTCEQTNRRMADWHARVAAARVPAVAASAATTTTTAPLAAKRHVVRQNMSMFRLAQHILGSC